MNDVQFDQIAEVYKKTKALPFRLLEEYTFFQVLGDVRDKRILDLACGAGHYTRMLKEKGTSEIIGVDISEEMLEQAREKESKDSYGIDYRVGDARTLGSLGEFDFVTAIYLLHFSETKEELLSMCKSIYANLKPGGRFVGYNDNVGQPVEHFDKFKQYALLKEFIPSDTLPQVNYTVYLPEGNTVPILTNFFDKETYEWAFKEAGFKELRWCKTEVPQSAIEVLGEDFWNWFIESPPVIAIEAIK